MKETLITESTKYGLAVLVLTVVCIVLSYAITILWKELNKRDKDNRELLKDTTIALKDLNNTVNVLIQKL